MNMAMQSFGYGLAALIACGIIVWLCQRIKHLACAILHGKLRKEKNSLDHQRR